MKRLFALSGIAVALWAGASGAHAQSSPPPLPALTAEQSANIEQRLDAYRQETERRVARGEITRNEADNLLAWREWQIARQVADGEASAAPYGDAPPDYSGDATPDARSGYDAPPPSRRDYAIVAPPPYYGPYYYRYPAPYYGGPYPYVGPSVCAGGFGQHFGGRICF
jgi:hypothetical protein